MGQGYKYVCKKCGEEYDIHTGLGMMFPNVYAKTMKDISEGRQGNSRKDLFKKIPYLAVDAEEYYYECEDCGFWSVEQGLDLYEPKDVDKIKKMKFGEKTVEELGSIPYVINTELKKNFVLIDKYEHKCPNCKGLMKKRNKRIISCPNCGTKNSPLGEELWD